MLKNNQKILQPEFFSNKKLFKVKQICSSQNDLVYVPRKIGKVEILEENSAKF